MNYPWLKKNWQQLLSQHHRQAVHHALLFSGAAGLGKRACAHAFAQLLLCDNGRGRDEACGTCQSCRWLSEGVHPDAYTITLQEKATTIKVDQIRELSDQLSQTSHRGGYQVVCLYPADTLSLAAANALLKTLEEPSGKVVFMLVTDYKDRLPITVQSRCQLQAFQMSQPDEAEQWLASQLEETQLTPSQLLRVAHGAPFLAKTLAEEGYADLQHRVLEQLIALLTRKEHPVAVTTVLMKLDIVRVFDTLLMVISDLIKRAVGASSMYMVLGNEQLAQFPAVGSLPMSSLHSWLSSCIETRASLQRHPGLNVQMALESLLIQWSTIKK